MPKKNHLEPEYPKSTGAYSSIAAMAKKSKPAKNSAARGP
jgi:hypothetical protein